MKILLLGNIEKKIFIILFIYIITVISRSSLEHFYFPTLKNYQINFSLKVIINYGFGIFFCIPEIIIRKSKRKEETNKKKNNIIYIFNKPKELNKKEIAILILIYIFFLVYLYVSKIYFIIQPEKEPLVNIEGFSSFEIIYFFLLSRIIDKSKFYQHQYIPLLIMILMGIIRFILNIRRINYEFIFPDDLLSIFFGLITPLIEAGLFFSIQKYMKYKYYSPFFIYFLMGAVFSVLSLIIYIIYMFIDCGENKICLILSKETIIEKITIFVIVVYSFIGSLYFFFTIVLINNFSVFHYFLFVSLERLIETIFSFLNYEVFEQIVIIVTFFIEIFAMLVFLEIIILTFCGFNYNIKNNIIFRAENEICRLKEEDDIDIDDAFEDSINVELNAKSNDKNSQRTALN